MPLHSVRAYDSRFNIVILEYFPSPEIVLSLKCILVYLLYYDADIFITSFP